MQPLLLPRRMSKMVINSTQECLLPATLLLLFLQRHRGTHKDKHTIYQSSSYLQVCPARRFYDYEFIPLSVGIVDKSLHGITVTNSIIERIARCLGKKGLFSKRWGIEFPWTQELPYCGRTKAIGGGCDFILVLPKAPQSSVVGTCS